MGWDYLSGRILSMRTAIRYHRDQRLDDRCWWDDFRVWRFLEDSLPMPTHLPGYEEMMRRCAEFYDLRRADTLDPIPADAVLDPAHWDDDVKAMNVSGLIDEIMRIKSAIREHRNAPLRTIDVDRALYRVLPEKKPADFRLPPKPEFLEEVRAPTSGCPSYWRSHASCPGAHNLPEWGPCPRKGVEP